MTQDQLVLFKELIKEVVKSAVKDAIKEELETSFKKDLKEVKQLLAKSIKEARIAAPTTQQNTPYQNSEQFKAKLREAVGSDFNMKQSPVPGIMGQPNMPMMSEDAAMNMSINGTLPNVDAPIPFINKSSLAWKEMSSKLV
jgi:hypothetical protein